MDRAVAGLIGVALGSAVTSLVAYLTKRNELRADSISTTHARTIDLITAYREKVKLLGSGNKGIFATHESPLALYWTYFRVLREIERDPADISPLARGILGKELGESSYTPEDHGF